MPGKNAKVLLFGLGDPEQKVEFNQFKAYTKELSIYTSYLNPHTTKTGDIIVREWSNRYR